MATKSTKTPPKPKVKAKTEAAKPAVRRSAKAQAAAQPNKLSESLKAAKALQKDEEKKARPEHVVNLINDTMWLFGLVVTIYLAISLLSFDMSDPAWSRSVANTSKVQNFGGLFGA